MVDKLTKVSRPNLNIQHPDERIVDASPQEMAQIAQHLADMDPQELRSLLEEAAEIRAAEHTQFYQVEKGAEAYDPSDKSVPKLDAESGGPVQTAESRPVYVGERGDKLHQLENDYKDALTSFAEGYLSQFKAAMQDATPEQVQEVRESLQQAREFAEVTRDLHDISSGMGNSSDYQDIKEKLQGEPGGLSPGQEAAFDRAIDAIDTAMAAEYVRELSQGLLAGKADAAENIAALAADDPSSRSIVLDAQLNMLHELAQSDLSQPENRQELEALATRIDQTSSEALFLASVAGQEALSASSGELAAYQDARGGGAGDAFLDTVFDGKQLDAAAAMGRSDALEALAAQSEQESAGMDAPAGSSGYRFEPFEGSDQGFSDERAGSESQGVGLDERSSDRSDPSFLQEGAERATSEQESEGAQMEMEMSAGGGD